MNLSAHPIVVPTKVVAGKVAPANRVLLVAPPLGTSGESTCGSQKDWILEELNLQDLEEWPREKQEWARKLLVKRGTSICPQQP